MRKTKEYSDQELSRIISEYTHSLVRLAFTYTKSVPDAEDIVQEVMVRLITKKPYFENKTHEKAWMVRVTINTSINYVKAVKRHKNEPLDYDIPEIPKEEYYLVELIDQLSEKYRTVLYLYYFEGYAIKEIAQIMKKSESTITTWMARGRKKLKGLLLEREGKL